MPQQIDTSGLAGTTTGAQVAAAITNTAETALITAAQAYKALHPDAPTTQKLTGVSGTKVLDVALFQNFDFTLTGATTISILHAYNGQRAEVRMLLRQDSVGGRVLTFPSGTRWAGGTAVALSTTANAVDLLSLSTWDGGTSFYATLTKAYA